jgi:hypothetical protein
MGHDCGKIVADNYCHMRGYAKALDFAMEPDIGHKTPLRLLDSALTCEKAFCDGFEYIACSAEKWRSPGPVLKIVPETGNVRVGESVTLRLEVRNLPKNKRVHFWWEVDGRLAKGKLLKNRKVYIVTPADTGPLTIRAHAVDADWNYLDVAAIVLHPVSKGVATSKKPSSRQTTMDVSGKWSTTFGETQLRQTDRKVTGDYSYSQGRIEGTLHGNVLDGHWAQKSSGKRCDTARMGSYYWGRLRFVFREKRFDGKWGYCEEPVTGIWNGTKH